MQNYGHGKFLAIPKSVQMQTEAKIYTFGYGTPIWQFLILHQVIVARRFRRKKISDMTNEERNLIKECWIMVIGTGTFVSYLKSELKNIGFSNIVVENGTNSQKNITTINIISEYGGNISSRLVYEMFSAPIIYPFDFVSGAGAMVIMPGDDRELLGTDKWILAQNLGYPRYKIQFPKHMKLKKNKTEVWTLCPSLEVGTKHPWKELQRQSLELR